MSILKFDQKGLITIPPSTRKRKARPHERFVATLHQRGLESLDTARVRLALAGRTPTHISQIGFYRDEPDKQARVSPHLAGIRC